MPGTGMTTIFAANRKFLAPLSARAIKLWLSNKENLLELAGILLCAPLAGCDGHTHIQDDGYYQI
jgi:hypothetical protein